MPLYLVVSEILSEMIPILDDGSGPLEPYAIIHLVCADSREQARYIAWQSDKNSTADFRDCPNFRTRKLTERFSGHGIVSDEKSFQTFWRHPKVADLFDKASADNF